MAARRGLLNRSARTARACAATWPCSSDVDCCCTAVCASPAPADCSSAALATELDCLLATVLHDEKSGQATIFALNRGAEDMSLTVELRGLGSREIVSAIELHDDNLGTSS
ncbi:MAG TPA: hypothetical protein VHU87_07795 [Rhizomicrobium sp.]|jgi:alpha-L-arabinofuranosidase|nr:hypothetical protein [Rhizomicrobium sp.]